MMGAKNSHTQYLKIKKSESVDDCIKYLMPLYDNNAWAKDELYDLLWSANIDCYDKQLFDLLSNNKTITPSGMGFLGRLYRDGRGVEKDYKQAITWFVQASDNNIKWARNELFHLLWCFNDKGTYNYLKELAEKYSIRGDPVASGYLARLYRDGKYISKDLNKALDLYRNSLNDNIFWINREYVDLLWVNNDSKTDKELFEYLRNNLTTDYYAEGYLGRMYRDGRYVKANYGLAIEYYASAAEKHIGWARNELMDLLWKIKKPDTLQKLFDLAVIGVNDEDPYSIGYMARLLRDGIETAVDIQSSVQMFKKAAEANIPWAVSELYSLIWANRMLDDLKSYADKYMDSVISNNVGSVAQFNHYSNNPVWVAFVGSINVNVEFLSTIMWCVDKRNKKYVEGIVFCTWDDQIDNYTGLRQCLSDIGIIVIEVKHPKYSSDKVGFGSRELQELQLKGCLDIIPDNSLVIKCRTDLTIDWLVHHESDLFDSYGINNIIDWGCCDIKYRIVPERELVPLIPPFRFGDPAFCCHKKDMKKIIDLTNTELTSYDYSSDDRLFQIHAKEFPIILDFMKYVKTEKLVHYRDLDSDFELPPILNKFYALYFVIIHKCYYYKSRKKQNYASLKDMFLSDTTKGSRLKELDISCVEAICGGKLVPTQGYLSLYNLIKELSDYNHAKEMVFTIDDWIKTAKWGIVHLGLFPEVWLKWPRFITPRSSVVNIQSIPLILNYDDSFMSIYNTIIAGSRLNLDKITTLKEVNYPLYIDCLVYQIRKWDINALDLYLDEYEKTESNSSGCFKNPAIIQRICIHSNLYLQYLRFKLVSSSSEKMSSIIGDYSDYIKINHSESLDELFSSLIKMIDRIVNNISPDVRKKVWEEELHMLLCGHQYFHLSVDTHQAIEKCLNDNKPCNLDDKYLKKLCDLYTNKKVNKRWAKYYLKMLSTHPNYTDYCKNMFEKINTTSHKE